MAVAAGRYRSRRAAESVRSRADRTVGVQEKGYCIVIPTTLGDILCAKETVKARKRKPPMDKMRGPDLRVPALLFCSSFSIVACFVIPECGF